MRYSWGGGAWDTSLDKAYQLLNLPNLSCVTLRRACIRPHYCLTRSMTRRCKCVPVSARDSTRASFPPSLPLVPSRKLQISLFLLPLLLRIPVLIIFLLHFPPPPPFLLHSLRCGLNLFIYSFIGHELLITTNGRNNVKEIILQKHGRVCVVNDNVIQ